MQWTMLLVRSPLACVLEPYCCVSRAQGKLCPDACPLWRLWPHEPSPYAVFVILLLHPHHWQVRLAELWVYSRWQGNVVCRGGAAAWTCKGLPGVFEMVSTDSECFRTIELGLCQHNRAAAQLLLSHVGCELL